MLVRGVGIIDIAEIENISINKADYNGFRGAIISNNLKH